MSAVLASTLLQATVLTPVAAADGGPSVPPPTVPSVPVTRQGHAAPSTGDETTPRALHGDQTGGGASLPGGGNYTATSLSPSATWEVSAQTGDFTWSYPIPTPPAPGGLQPNVALSYSSSAVDGLTSSTNNQASWIGDGWSLWPGFVERGYRSCVDDLDGGGEEPADLCWHTDNATLSLNGSATPLIRDDDSGVWKPKDDNGSRVERVTAAGNGDDNGESWKITTVDGTQYFFGSTPTTKSTWTVPVYGDDANEPCHQATFADSACVQAYRWNLDKVIDRFGNMIRFYYGTETNYYGQNKNSTAAQYVRGGWLDRIDYGLRADDATIAASGQVKFDVADRCVPGSDCTLTKPANLPDVPLNLKCDGGSCVDKWAPTFWSTKRLTTITTKSRIGTTYQPVDSWTLRHELPDPGDGEKAALWLKGITHTGHTGPNNATLALPEVTFDGARKPNRVHGTDGYAALIRFRMNAIVSESGGVTSINYAEPNCVFGSQMPANAQTNTLRCFPVQWTPPGSPERTDYFHKYVVASIADHDGVAGSLAVETSYEYLDGAAWHFDTSELVPDDRKTWNEFRGFGRVRVRTGSGNDGPQTMTEQRFYRGMHGDKLPSGTRSVTVTDTENASRTDWDWLRGQSFESATFDHEAPSNQPDPPRITKTVTVPTWQGPTAARGTLKAYIVRTGEETTYTPLAAGGRRITHTETTYDGTYGLPTTIDDRGDTTIAGDDLCTTTAYRPNTTKWLIDFPSRVETVSRACGQTPTFPDDAVTDVRNSYDNQAAGQPPTTGNVTKTEEAAERPASGPVYVTQATSTYDKHGRVTAAADALGNTTKTAYTPTVGGPLTQIVATTPPTTGVPTGLVTTTVVDARRGVPTTVTDPNGRVTEVAYDPLGRSSQVWLPNRRRADYPDGSLKFAYQIRTDGPNVVTTSKIGPNGVFTSSNTLYDGLLRPRQVQTAAVGGGRLLTDTRYDSQGRGYKTSNPYFNEAAVDADLWLPTDNTVPGLNVTEFDGAGRPTAQVFLGSGDEKWRTTTSYGGDRINVTPPQGGTATTTITDARDRTTELRQYQAPAPTGAYDATTYTYTPAGQLKTVTDPADNTWTYTYDLRGRQTTSADPDRGTTTTTYDDADRVTSTLDARGSKLAYSYDSLGRKTATYVDHVGGTKLAGWVYDTAYFGKGYLKSATRYVGADAYTFSVYHYTTWYKPSETTVTIPAAEQELADDYTWYGTYGTDGSLSGESYPAAGALPRETVNYVLDHWGRPLTSSGAFNGTVELVTGTDYTRYGEPQRIQLGDGTKRAWLSYYYDDNSRRLNRTVVDAEVSNPMQADVNYTYDPAGNLTSIADTTQGQTADRQCLRYDQLRRLTEAWTPTTGCGTDPAIGALGGPAAYWRSYGYDQVGNRTSEIQHAAAGNTTRTYAYQAHTLDTVSTTGTSGGTVEEFGYDPTGNTTSREIAGDGQTLEWDAEGHLAKVTNSDGDETSFVYDADGNRLIRRDPQAVTLYLGNEEIRLDRGSHAETGTRYYNHGGQTVAVRTESGLSWLASDHHGTEQISINSTTLQVDHRRHLPFGEPRGAAPSSWPGQHGFVGGTRDETTGLTHLGAREYDPTLGRFLSVDPVLAVTDPQQMQGYTYSNNNPATFADPTGLKFFEGDSGGAIDAGACRDGRCGQAPPSPALQKHRDVQTKLHAYALGQKPSKDTLASLKALGYRGSRDFNWADALQFASQDETAFRAVCQLAVGNSDECRPDVWNWDELQAGLVRLAEFGYQLTPISDAISCAKGDGEGCAWLAASFVPGSRVIRAADNVVDAANAAQAASKAAPAFARSRYTRMTPSQRAGALEKSPTCPYCGDRPSTQADHITPLKRDWESGGWEDDKVARSSRVNDPGNLIGACQPCNASKGAREIGPGSGQWWPPGWPSGAWWPYGGP